MRLVAIIAIAGCSEHGFNSQLEPVVGATGDTGVVDTQTTTPSVTDTDTLPDPEDAGLEDGHFDVDTTTFISIVDRGTTEGHIHQYDDLFDVAGIDFLAPLHPEIQALGDIIEDPDLPFVLVVINPDLSPGARLSLASPYNPNDATSWVGVQAYADIPLNSLVRYTMRTLPALGIWFSPNAIANGELVGADTACVRNNVPGPAGEWRNGALTVQAIRADQLQTNPALSVGGVQGAATGGLLWEGLVFWHWFEVTCR